MRVTISKQILLVCIMIVIAFTGLSVYTYFQIDNIQAGYDGVLKRSVPLVIEVKELNIELNNQASQVNAYYLSGDPKYTQAYDASRQKMNATVSSLEKKLITPEGKQKVDGLKASLAAFHQVADQGITTRKNQGLEEAVKTAMATAPKVEAAEKTMNDTVTFLVERMEQRTKENVAAGDKMQAIVGILDFIIFLFACVAAFLLARRISRPLKQMVQSAQSIADGDLRIRRIEYKSNDEISDMLTAFTAMTNNLHHVVTQVAKAAQQVLAASEELTASSEQSAQASVQVAETIINVASGAASQVSSVEGTVEVVQKMASAIHQITSNANSASTKSSETAKAASDGSEAVCQANNQMQLIQDSVTKSAEVVQKLGASSQQIGEFVDLISGIAGQTNLLALNAAIEAARAGEQGRGFAVVADEVRKLAEQSHEAAQKVTVIIRGIQLETNTAVTTMNQGNLEVTKGTKVIAATGERLNLIVSMVEQLNGQIQEISTASEELSAFSDEVVHSVDGVKTVAAETAADTETISATTEEQSASIQEIASSSHELSNMANELQMIVSKFRL